MVADDWGDEAEAGVGGINAHEIHGVQEELKRLGEGTGMVDVRCGHELLDHRMAFGGLGVAFWGLNPRDELDRGDRSVVMHPR